ncbi:MAG: hypothetical protein LW834_01235 [Cyanobium sp. 49614_E6]|jgi:hypothetical protein|nr:hypothetical protein [Cyanobium sp. 49614_E6]
MPINDVTATQGFQKPNAANLLSEDVVRLRGALDALDTEINALEQSRAALASPTFTGTPAAPTAAVDTNTTQIATTAFVVGQAGTATPQADGTAAVGTSLRFARQDHVHPTDTTRAALASPTFTGTPRAPTAGVDTNTTQLATTAFVVGQGYLKATDAANTYAPLASPTFTGNVTLQGASYSNSISSTATGWFGLPSGSTAQRGSPTGPSLRFNTSFSQFESFNGTDWLALGQGATGGGGDQIFQENGQVVTQNYTIANGKNAVSAGPITVNAGVTVTLSAGSTWVIV